MVKGQTSNLSQRAKDRRKWEKKRKGKKRKETGSASVFVWSDSAKFLLCFYVGWIGLFFQNGFGLHSQPFPTTAAAAAASSSVPSSTLTYYLSSLFPLPFNRKKKPWQKQPESRTIFSGLLTPGPLRFSRCLHCHHSRNMHSGKSEEAWRGTCSPPINIKTDYKYLSERARPKFYFGESYDLYLLVNFLLCVGF